MSSDPIGLTEGPGNPVEKAVENQQEAGNQGKGRTSEAAAVEKTVAPATVVGKSPVVENIDEDGDLVLHVGPTSNLRAFKIDSSTLRRTSEVFRAWICRWRTDKPSDSQWVFDLPEDNPASLKTILHIVHGQFDQATKTMAESDGSMLYELLVLCDKYNMAYMIKPWANAWLNRTIKDTQDKPSYWKLAFIAWELGRYDLFTESCQNIILTSQASHDGSGLVAYGCQLGDCRLGPLEMEGLCMVVFISRFVLPTNRRTIERFEPIRYAIIQALLDFYHTEVKDRLLGKVPTHSPVQPTASHSVGRSPTLSFDNTRQTSSRSPMTNTACNQIVLGGIIQATVTLLRGSTKTENMDAGILVLLPTEASELKDSPAKLIGQMTTIFQAVQPLGYGHEICHPAARFLSFQKTIKEFTAECNKGWEGLLLTPADKDRLAKRKVLFG
ncbi:uncharacterized protein PODANS_6_10060 [Podospora anserina S mat+]|uniref:Podospora anserina S mat+ genomic DNA chromosome 6, supercontig 4 n=1 Tax=Podospora anserina (strain S / ATCC MYA-4624 / DSM 980 / FGSC 10383) TaxID=515849 RepID=B2ANB2_PODAN|nr:uncharacterized protein PODANS_6_10060 [Podospora anserina S mat+]CAP65510.1 unnamed protein product [Podospora anserina S mat+]CDP31505.1 Putative protein of unknown function [Podospora anserina S mat+]